MNEKEKAKLKAELEKVKAEPEELRKLSVAATTQLAKRRDEIKEILAEVEEDSA